MNRKFLTAAVFASFAFLAPLQALELQNEDSEAYLVEITDVEGTKVVEKKNIKPGEKLTGICMDGCVISLENGEESAFAGLEVVSIRKGLFETAE